MSDLMNALREVRAGSDARLARLQAGITRLIWMVGVNLVLTLAILVRLFTH